MKLEQSHFLSQTLNIEQETKNAEVNITTENEPMSTDEHATENSNKSNDIRTTPKLSSSSSSSSTNSQGEKALKKLKDNTNDRPTTSLAAVTAAIAAAAAAGTAALAASEKAFPSRTTRQYKVGTASTLGEGDCSRTTALKAIPAIITEKANNIQDAQPSTSNSAAAAAAVAAAANNSSSSSSSHSSNSINSSNDSSTDNTSSTGLAAAYKAMLAEMQRDLQQQAESGEFNDDTWNAGNEDDVSSVFEVEEMCTCDGRSTRSGSVASLNGQDEQEDVVEVLPAINYAKTLNNTSNVGKIQVATDRLFGNTHNKNNNKSKETTSNCSKSSISNNNNNDLTNCISMVSITDENAQLNSMGQQRKRKYNESRLVDDGVASCSNARNSTAETCRNVGSINSAGNISGCGSSTGTPNNDVNSRKRIAYDVSSTPRATQGAKGNNCDKSNEVNTPNCVQVLQPVTTVCNISPHGRRTPRSIIPTRDNPPPELHGWLLQFQKWTHVERLVAVDRLIAHCEPTQVRHMMKVIEPQFQRDFISLLPRELALQVLSYLEPKDLLRAAQTCRSWRFLCDDNLLWKEKCRKAKLLTVGRDKPKRGRTGNMPPISSLWKAAYMRQHIIELNWRSRPIRQPKVLKGHDDHVITCLQFHGNRIVSGSDDNTLKVWSAVTGRCLRTLVGHTGGVWSSQMSGNIIVSGSTDRTLKVWDMDTGHCVHTLMGHTSTVRCMHLHGHKVVSGSRDATLRVWDIKQGVCLHVLLGHLAAVRCVQYDGKLIVSGAYDYMVKIWHPERQECLHTLQGHTNRVYSLQFDGVHVVSGSLDTSIRVWDAETGNCKHTLMGHQSLTSGMELRQNILVSGNADSTVKVWDITTGQCLQTLSGPNKHQSAVTCLQFNSRFVVTSSDDGTVKLWDVNTGEFIRNLVALESGGSGGVVWRIRANDTKLICAVGSRNGTEETKLMVLDFDVEGACVKCS